MTSGLHEGEVGRDAGEAEEALGGEGVELGVGAVAGEVREGHVGADADDAVGGQVVEEQGATRSEGGHGIDGRGGLRMDKRTLQTAQELGLGVEVELFDMELAGLDLRGRSDDGQIALVVTLTGNAEREGAEMFKLDVATVVEVAGGDVGDGLDDTLQVGRTERAGLADIGRHLVEADGTRLDGNGVKTGSNGSVRISRRGKFAEFVLDRHKQLRMENGDLFLLRRENYYN